MAAGIKLFFKDFNYLFPKKGERREKDREKHQCTVASLTPPTGDLANNPGTCPDWGSNQRPLASQDGTQFTVPHQPGLKLFLKRRFLHIPLAKKTSFKKRI